MKFSIVIPTYNRATFLPKAIESVLSQTYTDWELIIVDDGSTDNTKDVVSQYGDSRIRYVYQQNAERSAARNNGIMHAMGDYICFMDSDEYLYSERLEELSNAIKNNSNSIACYYTDIRFEGYKKYIRTGKYFQFPIDKDELICFIIGAPQLCCATEILRKHQFNPALSIGEDMELLFRITNEFPLVYVPNQATVVEVEHEGRSVNIRNSQIFNQMKTLSIMRSKGHPASTVSSRIYDMIYSGCYLRYTKYYIKNHQRIMAVFSCLRSIIYAPSNMIKYKMNILLSLLFNKKKLKRLLDE